MQELKNKILKALKNNGLNCYEMATVLGLNINEHNFDEAITELFHEGKIKSTYMHGDAVMGRSAVVWILT